MHAPGRRSRFFIWILVLGLAPLAAADELASLWQQELTAARSAKSSNDFETANAAYERALARAESFGENDPRIARTLEEMSSTYARQKDRERALTFQQRALEIRLAAGNASSTAHSHLRLGKLYMRFASPELAESHLRDALTLRESQAEPGSGLAGILRELAGLIQELRPNDPEIETLHLRMIELGDTPQKRARLANHYSRDGRRELAIEQLLSAIELERGREAVDARQLVSLMTKVAEQYRVLGMLADAEGWMEQALDTREARLGTQHPYLAFTLRQLASIFVEDERYSEAEALLMRARDLNTAAWGQAADQCSCRTDDLLEQVHRALGRKGVAADEDGEETPTSIDDGAEPSVDQALMDEIERLNDETTRASKEGRLEEAKQHAGEVLALLEQLHGSESLEYVAGLSRVARVLRDQRRLDEAAEIHEQRLTILEGLLDADDVRLAPVLGDLAAIARDLKRAPDAEQLVLRENAIRDGIGQNLKVARSLEMLGSLLLSDRQPGRAEIYFAQAAERWESFAGADAPEIVRSLTSMVRSQIDQGRFDEAEAQLGELLERIQSRRFPDASQQVLALQSLKDLLQKQGRAKEATEIQATLTRLRELRKDYSPAVKNSK